MHLEVAPIDVTLEQELASATVIANVLAAWLATRKRAA